MEWWGYLAAGLGAVVLISNGINAVKNIFKPVLNLSDRITEVEKHDKNDLKRFEDIESHQATQDEVNKAMMKTLYAISNHMIDGNGIDRLKAARDDLTKFIIEH